MKNENIVAVEERKDKLFIMKFRVIITQTNIKCSNTQILFSPGTNKWLIRMYIK